MGMDSVEIVLRCEEVFGIDLPDDECGQIVTVGDLYRLVLHKLNLPYEPASPQQSAVGISRIDDTFPTLTSWTTRDVWTTVHAVIVDQLQVREEEVTESATFQADLRCD